MLCSTAELMYMWLYFRHLQATQRYFKPFVFMALSILGVVFVVLIGQYHSSYIANAKIHEDEELRRQESYQLGILSNFSSENILAHLERLTRKPHMAGTEANCKAAQYIYNTWKQQGLDLVEFKDYNDVLLSYPNYDKPNKVALLDDSSGEILFETTGLSPAILPKEQSYKEAKFIWNAYSASGNANGQLVYVNYGRKEDFDFVERQRINVSGKIVIVRYGEIWRGSKAYEAQLRGAIGCLIYNDPADFAPNNSAVYPNTIFLPPKAAQRGSLLMTNGDPLTPGFPAKNYTFRELNEAELRKTAVIPSIPVQPLSYSDALMFLANMTGTKAPKSWQGGLKIQYRLGPSHLVKMTVATANKPASIRNVIGYITGATEPDRYVLVGNHFDAWTYGAVDPNSATAVMLEMSLRLMKVINETGRKPRRTIVFCAWDAEEFGLIGSNEWLEENAKILSTRAVAYLNVDLIEGNKTLQLESVPMLYRAAVAAAKLVSNPDANEIASGRKTVYDTWLFRSGKSAFDATIPNIMAPGDGSDHAMFLQKLGIPVADITYTNWPKPGYPLYHTQYETIFLPTKLMDPNGLKFSIAVGQFWAILTRMLADNCLIPFNVVDYAKLISNLTGEIGKEIGRLQLSTLNDQIDQLNQSTYRFQAAAEKFHIFINYVKSRKLGIPTTDEINSRLMLIERNFLNFVSPVVQRGHNHIIYGTNPQNPYEGKPMPIIYQLINQYRSAPNRSKEKSTILHNLQLQLTTLQYAVESAILTLKKIP